MKMWTYDFTVDGLVGLIEGRPGETRVRRRGNISVEIIHSTGPSGPVNKVLVIPVGLMTKCEFQTTKKGL